MSTVATWVEARNPMLRLHLEPNSPLEIGELTGALNALSKQYQTFATRAGHATPGTAKLLVSNVAPGSIEINFIPDMASLGAIFGPMLDQMELLVRFAEQVQKLLDLFRIGRAERSPETAVPTIAEANDAINIAAPIANHGGSQTVTVVNGTLVQNVFTLTDTEARLIADNATREKALLQSPEAERRQRVSLVWSRLDRVASSTGERSPDRGTIDEIDRAPHAILFTDEMAHLKQEMLAGEENPHLKVYFVDVEISRIAERVTAYRVYGYHGKDDFLPT